MDCLKIVNVTGREILDSRATPTVEAVVMLTDGTIGKGMSPSGASTGKFEALELRDEDKERYMGKGVLKAVNNINTIIKEVLVGMDTNQIYAIDKKMKEADGTKDKSLLGANAILAVSIAAANAAATVQKESLYHFLGGSSANCMPVPMMNIINGGVHAKNNLDFQEFMIMPIGACCFREALRMGTEVYHALKQVLTEKGLSTAVGDEGGFAPNVADAREALQLLVEAVTRTSYQPGKDIVFSMDAAASELYQKESGMYFFPGEAISRTTEEMVDYYEKLAEEFPIVSIEDGLDEEDWEGWNKMTKRLGEKIQLVGDDLFVTNTERLEMGIKGKCANSILIKLNQIGSLSETIEAIKMAKRAGYTAIVSHRSGETEDTTIADLAVALNCGQIKTGAPCRSERVAKYNRLLKIEEELGDCAEYLGINAINCKMC